MWLSSHRQAYGFSPLIYNRSSVPIFRPEAPAPDISPALRSSGIPSWAFSFCSWPSAPVTLLFSESSPERPAALPQGRKSHGRCRPRRTSSCQPVPDRSCHYPDTFPRRIRCGTFLSLRDAHDTEARRLVKSLLSQIMSPFRKDARPPVIFLLCVCLPFFVLTFFFLLFILLQIA